LYALLSCFGEERLEAIIMTTTTQALEQQKSQENKSSVKKAKKNKKKRVSKHILESRGEGSNIKQTEAEKETTTTEQAVSSKTKKNKKRKRNDRCKDPTEVLTYLSTWKAHQENNDVEWKYNKNTQSWLIRHMYDSEKVPKNVFTITVEYLLGIQSETLKQRIIDDATRRALRYKQYEKDTNNNNEGGGEGKQNNTTDIDGNTSTKDTDETNQQQQQQDDEHWMKLDDHDKRKEYKRARKILESSQQE
jgi:hypothetical protein